MSSNGTSAYIRSASPSKELLRYNSYDASGASSKQQTNYDTMSKNPQISTYSVVKVLSSGDPLCRDQFGNSYVLMQLGEAIDGDIELPVTLIAPHQIVLHEESKYAAYILPDRTTWLGDISVLKFKSELFCIGILSSVASKVMKPLLALQLNQQLEDCLQWVQVENIWVRETSVFYLMGRRVDRHGQVISESVTLDNYQSRLVRKFGKILTLFFKPDRERKTFMAMLLHSMSKGLITIDGILELLQSKKLRKLYMQERQAMEKQLMQAPKSIYDENSLWRDKVKKSNNRREYRYAQEDNYLQAKRGSMPVETMRLGRKVNIDNMERRRASIGVTGMFEVKSTNRSTSNSHSKHRYYLSNKKSHQISNKSSDYSPMKGLSTHLETINHNLMERAYRKYHETIDISSACEGPMSEQEKFRTIQEKRIGFESRSRPKSPQVDNKKPQFKSYLRRDSSKKLREMEEVKKQLFITTDSDNYDTTYKIKQYVDEAFNEKLQQQRESKQLLQRLKDKQYMEEQSAFQMKHREQQQSRRQQERARQVQNKIQRLERQRKELQQKARIQQMERDRQRQALLELQRREREIRETKFMEEKEIEVQNEIRRRKQEESRKLRQKEIEDEIRRRKEREIEQQVTARLLKEREERRLKEQMANQKMHGNVEEAAIDNIEVIQPILKSEIEQKKQQQLELERKRQKQRLEKVSKPPIPKSEKKIGSRQPAIEDELEEVVLIGKGKKQTPKPVTEQIQKPHSKPDQTSLNKNKSEESLRKIPSQSNKRVNTGQSSVASSYGPKKPVSKQVAEYIHMINKIGEAVAKTSKLSSKLGNIEWFTGIYFVYKRFLFERKKVLLWLQKKMPYKLTRYEDNSTQRQWQEWFETEQSKSLQEKTRAQNENIVVSITKMNKKLMKKNIPGNFLHHASLAHHSSEETKIAVSEVVKQYDELDDKKLLNDPEIFSHIHDLLTSIYIIAELEHKNQQKKPLLQIIKKKSQEEVAELSDYLYDLYIPQ